jgi:hypothetical protein
VGVACTKVMSVYEAVMIDRAFIFL